MQVWKGVTMCAKSVTSELQAVTNPLHPPRPPPRPMQGLSAALVHDTQHRHLQAAATCLPRPSCLCPVHFAHTEVCLCGGWQCVAMGMGCAAVWWVRVEEWRCAWGAAMWGHEEGGRGEEASPLHAKGWCQWGHPLPPSH